MMKKIKVIRLTGIERARLILLLTLLALLAGVVNVLAADAQPVAGQKVQAHNDNEEPDEAHSTTPSSQANRPIIVDHTVVDKYNDIPQEYIDKVKTMWLDVPGESHSGAYRKGCELLEALDSRFQVNVIESGEPEAPTDQHLRVSRAARNASNTNWGYGYGEANWYTNAQAITQTKNHLTYANTHNLEIAAMGFGWCWDMTWINSPTGTVDSVYQVRWAGSSVGGPDGNRAWGLDDGDYALTGNRVNMNTYISATEEYIAHCAANNYPTKVFFTTGPVDGYTGESGYQRYLKHEHIRNYVRASSDRILFDYADILTWGDDGTQNTSQSWIDHSGVLRTFPYIHPDNMRNMDGSTTDDDHDHIGERGALRLAKALWWMLARIAGWDGEAGPQKTVSTETATYSQTITYTIAVRTTNLPPTVTIELSDTLPAGLAYLPGTLIATAGSVDESNAPTLRWSGVLTPAPAITISYAAIVTTTDPQIITNTASIAAAGYQFTPTAGVAILGGSRASDESGNWSAPATWEGDSVPIDGDSVTISSGTTVTVDVDVRCYRLLVEPGAKLVLPEGVTLLVTDRVTNQGTLQQTYAVNNDDIAFLEISDGSGAVRYRGVDVAAAGDLGAVTASIRAMAEGEGCTPAWTEAGAYARRCFEITAQNSTTASLRLWAPADELGGVTTPAVFRYVAPDWVELTNNAIWGTNGDYTYAQADSPGFSHLLMAQSMGAPTPSDVVLQMHFNGNTRDSSVNKFPGTWWGTVAYTSGISGQALDLSAAITNYVMIAQNDRLGGMEQLIVSVWARKNDPDVGGTLVTKAGQYQLVLSNRYVYSYVGNEAGVYGRANSSRLDTVYNTDWHHYVLTYDGALVKLYVDDEQVAEGPLTGTVKLNSMHHLYIGKDPWGGSFDGQIDELVIYNDIPDAHASDESGNWSTPATWEGNVTPGASDIVTISTATTVTVDADTQCHTLTIEPGATLVIPAGVALTVTSGVVNQGRLLQVQAVNNGHAAFLEIGDGGGLVHHRGVEIDTPNDLGTVTVTLRALGNGEYCTTTGGGAPAYARRCFEIETTRAATASLRLWALQSEISPTVITPAIFRHSGDTWVELTDNTAIGIDDDYQYVQADTPGFSHFLIGQSGHAPTAVSQRELGAADRQPPGWLLIGLALAASAAFGFRHLRRRRKRRSERLHRKETAMKKHSAYTVLLGLTLLAALSGRVAARPQRAPVAEEALAVIRQDCTGYGGPYPCYESLSAWQAAYGGIDFGTHPQGDLVAADKIAVARIEGVWTQADTTPLNLSGWTTDAEHYVRIYTTSEARHNGTPGSGYRLATTGSRPVTGSVAHFRIEGLELHSLSAGTPIYARPGADIDGEMLFSHNLIRGDGVDSAHGIYLYDYDGVAKIWNNVIYDVGSLGYTAGIQTSRGTTYIYNNTVVDIIAGYAIRSDGVTVVKNNLTEAPNDDFYGVFYPGSDFNASSDDTAPGFHSRQEQTFAFVNRASDDFHLASTDAGARNHGTDLSSDPLIPITNDIDSDTRSGGWDVGADEATSGTDTVPPIRFDGAPSGTLPSDTTEVTLTLSTNEAATCRYATTPGVAYGSMTETFSLTGGITHTQSVSGLVDEQTYRYYVRCQDLASSINGDDYEISFYVFSSDRVPPVVSNVQAVDVTPYSARITWDTDEACTSQVEHGLTGAYGTISPISSTRVTSHSLTLVGLDASTTYHFRVRSQDVAYNETVSGDGTFSTAALGNFHYVDQKHPSASDANSGTTVDDPWLTIQHAADVAQPGDIIVVYPGSYGRVTISAGGTPGHYITFRGLNVPDQGLVDPEVLFDPANPVPVPGNPVVNAVMRGFTLQPPYLITEPVSYVRIENLEITNISAAGYTGGRAVSMNNTAHVQLVNNFIHDVNPAAHGMGIVGSGHANIGNVIKGNTLYRVQGVGISISGRNWLVEDNDISHGIDANTYTGEYDGTDTDAIRFFGSGHVIRNNTMRDYLREEQLGVPHIDCFQTFSANPDGLQFAYDILVEGNSCDDFGQMLMIEDQAEAEGRGNLVHHVTLRNNVFRGARAATINGSCDYFTLVNNVVAESHYTAFMASNHPYLTVVNNIFYNNGAGSQIIDEDAKVGTVWDYNIYYPDFDWPTKQPGYDQHSLFGTGPGFVDPAAGDFRLRVDSPAIDAGIALTEFNYDRYATARPQGQAWDIGAHEVLVEGEITVSPMSLAFGDQDVDTGATAAQAVTIANDGTADLHVSGIDLAGADASAFIVQSGGGAVTLTQGSAHTVQVAFDPSTPGLKSAVLRVRSDDSDEDTVDVALSGTATAADAPTLGIVKTVTPMQAQPGQTITYTIAISNRGGGVATDVVMTDPLPVGVSFGRQLQGSLLLPVGDNVYQWGPYDVAAHTAYTIQFTSNVTDAVAFVGRTIANTAYFSAANHLPGASEGAPLIIGRRIYLPLVLRSP